MTALGELIEIDDRTVLVLGQELDVAHDQPDAANALVDRSAMADADQLKIQTTVGAAATMFEEGEAAVLTDGHTFASGRSPAAWTRPGRGPRSSSLRRYRGSPWARRDPRRAGDAALEAAGRRQVNPRRWLVPSVLASGTAVAGPRSSG